MAPKFSNYLFRNLKSSAQSSLSGNAGAAPADPVPAEDQEIVLRPEDFTTEPADALNWTVLESKEVRVKLKQTEGLMEGRVTLPAKVLRDLHPGLVPDHIRDDTGLPVSLRSVVLQLQNMLISSHEATDAAGAADFDTPIAQVAREDEGFFNLQEKTHRPSPLEAPASEEPSSFLPLIREKAEPRKEPNEIPAVQVVLPAPRKDAPPKESVRINPFGDLPKPKIASEHLASPVPVRGSERPIAGEQRKESVKPTRRAGLERLQELFLTDDLLDAAQVAQWLRAFPKVRAVLILLEDGTVLGGQLPESYRLDAVPAAPELMRAVREFGTALSTTEVSALTVLADMPISIFQEGRICLLVAHEGRGLLPGMRDRFTDIAKALDALYDPGTEDARPTGS